MKQRYVFVLVSSVLFFMLGIDMAVPTISSAAGYPDHVVQLVIPNVAGAQTDITGRILAGELEKVIGTKIVVNNKPGASTVLGADYVVRAKKDGYTLLYAGASAMVYAPITNPEVVHYDPTKDVESLGLHFFLPQTITVRSDAPWKTFPELVDYAKKNPGKVRVSTTGVGSSPHFILEMIQAMTGAQFTHVPFEGGESVVTAVLGGHVEATCEAVSKVKPHVEAGKMRILLITNKMAAYSTIPTITELGYKQDLPLTWWGLWAGAGIPEEARKVLVPAVQTAVNNSKPRIDQLGHIAEYRSPAEVRKLREEEYKKLYEIAVKIGLRKQ
jgi:tripartite-type tricarboxylate transporter receptor subunit TctC